MKNLSITIAGVDDREYLVAEIWQGDTMIAELNRETQTPTLILYNAPGFACGYNEFMNILKEAKASLDGNMHEL